MGEADILRPAHFAAFVSAMPLRHFDYGLTSELHDCTGQRAIAGPSPRAVRTSAGIRKIFGQISARFIRAGHAITHEAARMAQALIL